MRERAKNGQLLPGKDPNAIRNRGVEVHFKVDSEVRDTLHRRAAQAGLSNTQFFISIIMGETKKATRKTTALPHVA
jgi:hypothetical protein